jgi:hypothetical protein
LADCIDTRHTLDVGELAKRVLGTWSPSTIDGLSAKASLSGELLSGELLIGDRVSVNLLGIGSVALGIRRGER